MIKRSNLWSTLIFLVLLIPLSTAWLSSWGSLSTGAVELNEPVLVAHPDNELKLNDIELNKEVNRSIQGQELVNFNSKALPGSELNQSLIKFNFKAMIEQPKSQILEVRLRYTNSSGTFIACKKEVEISETEYRDYDAKCRAEIEASNPVKYHLEFVGAPNTSYKLSVDGSTYIEVEV